MSIVHLLQWSSLSGRADDRGVMLFGDCCYDDSLMMLIDDD